MTSRSSTPWWRPGSGASTPWYRRWWALLLVFPAAVLALVGLLVFFYLFTTIPLPEDIAAQPTVVLDARGRQVGTLSAEVARQDVQLSNLPEHVPQAVLAAEDRAFYSHGGISPTGVLRALFTNVRAGGIQAGGSTITQQYIKNAALSSERTFTRKAKEAALAVKVERRYSKDQILQLYLNAIYLGRGAYGIEAAARTYFGTSATKLGVNQAATLAGIIRAPEALDPAARPEAADERRRYVLDGMLSEGWIDQAAHDRAVRAGLPDVRADRGVASGANAYFLDAVQRELQGELSGRGLYTGLTIHTTLDQRMQRIAQRQLRRAVGGQPYTGALVAVDPTSGGVRALVGGPSYTDQPFNYAVRGGSQVGSSFKPLTLATLVAQGHGPDSRVPGPDPLTVAEDRAVGAECQWSAEDHDFSNYSRRGYGQVTARQATVDSINTAYVNLQLEVGCPAVIDTAATLGLPEQAMTDVLSLTLGVANFSPLQMASAYGVFAAGGTRAQPHLTTRVDGPEGEVLYEADTTQEGVYGANDAAVVTDVLTDVIAEGTGTAARIDRPAAGKTGTTTDYRDAWFVGYTPQLSTAVWIGGADEQAAAELQVTGGSVPAETWAAFMGPAMEPLEVRGFPEPDLSQLEPLNPTPAPCPSGYQRVERQRVEGATGPTDAPTERRTTWQVLEGSEDDTGRVCARRQVIEPSPTPTEPSPTPTETTTTDPTASPTPSETTTTTDPTTSPSPSETSTDAGGGGGLLGG